MEGTLSSHPTGPTSTKRHTFLQPYGRVTRSECPATLERHRTTCFPGDPEEQLRGAFRNIASTLAEAGASWSDVVEINSYHVGLRNQADFLLSVAAEFLKAPYPAWTPVGVTELWPPEAVVEIRCVAVVADRGQ